MTDTVTNIITRVQRLITLPTDTTLFNTNDYMAFMNDCLIEKVYPRLMKVREDYFLVRDVFNLQNSQAQDLYPTGVIPIPNRAWGNTLREVRYIDVSGNYYKMNPYFLEDLDLYQSRNLSFSSAFQKGYVNFNNGIKLVPPPSQDPGSIEMHYIITPSILINFSSDGGGFTSIDNMTFDSSTNIATYTTHILLGNTADGTYLDAYCPVNSSQLFDIYNGASGMLLATNVYLTRGFDNFADQTSVFSGPCTVQNGTDIISPNITEISNFQPGGYPIADPFNGPYSPSLYLVPAGQCPFTPLPPVLDNLLVYELAIKILSAQGYVEELQIFMQEHADLRKDLLAQMAMRVECEPYVISNKRGLKNAIMYGAMRTRRNI